MAKAMTLRMADEQAAVLETVARVEGRPVTEVVRAAIDRHIEAVRADKDFQAQLRRILDEDRAVLERLAR